MVFFISKLSRLLYNTLVPATGHVLQDFLQNILQDRQKSRCDVPATGHVPRDKVLMDIINDIGFLHVTFYYSLYKPYIQFSAFTI